MAKRIAAKKQGPPRGPPGFAADERAAMKQRAQELKAERPAALAPPTCREYAPIPDLLPALRAHRRRNGDVDPAASSEAVARERGRGVGPYDSWRLLP
jgi:hypothetical protein